jgi:hypothetical protein
VSLEFFFLVLEEDSLDLEDGEKDFVFWWGLEIESPSWAEYLFYL